MNVHALPVILMSPVRKLAAAEHVVSIAISHPLSPLPHKEKTLKKILKVTCYITD